MSTPNSFEKYESGEAFDKEKDYDASLRQIRKQVVLVRSLLSRVIRWKQEPGAATVTDAMAACSVIESEVSKLLE